MKIELFFDDVVSTRIFASARFWVNLSEKQFSLELDNPAACLLFDYNLEKKHQAKIKSRNQTFSTKSTALIPTVMSDLVASSGVTILFYYWD